MIEYLWRAKQPYNVSVAAEGREGEGRVAGVCIWAGVQAAL
jgi:hypothetical protein